MKRLSREQELKVLQKYGMDASRVSKNKQDLLIRKISKNFKKKKDDYVMIQYLTKQKEVKFKLCKIISGSIIVIKNKAYSLEPHALWRFGKYFFYIHREIDTMPVSNEDYEKLVKDGRCTAAHVILIKAVLGAVNKPSPIEKKNIGIIIGIIAAIAVVAFLFMG